MSYTATATASSTFTKTDAQYLASRIAADLKQVQQFYGKPSDTEITDYVVEAAVLLHHRLLDNVKYGYKLNGYWIFAIEYSTNYLGQLQANDMPGSIPPAAQVTGASWSSYLSRRTNADLSEETIQSIDEVIPVSRTGGSEPQFSGGQWESDKGYERSGVGLQRRTYWSAA
jgi:hypothetical protein